MRRILSIALFLFGAIGSIPVVADVIVGLPADSGVGNCYPFNCGYSGEYQQVYSSTQFSEPIIITGLEFFNTKTNQGATSMHSGNWTISLSTTSADWNTLSSNFDSNKGSDNTQVFSGNLSQPWAFGNTLSIKLSTPFDYDPSNGNLLMDVVASGVSGIGVIFFDTNGFNNYGFNGNNFMGRNYFGNVDSGYGLVTGFSTSTDPSTVPEPTSLLLLGTGLAGIGLAAWRKKK